MELRDERAVMPIGSYNATYGVTLSLPSVVGRNGVVQIFEPDLSEEEREALRRSAETLSTALAHMQKTHATAKTAPGVLWAEWLHVCLLASNTLGHREVRCNRGAGSA